uniref:Parasitic phase-specific protein PSP-1 n=1 Tax=Coccidioides posadasii RMSCC 3488 TaxID=454284 RepID=A0A0J6FDM0_COCPO|nr:hypothetical protein CPAG_03704 [Coccidioides posadasii RMSCC 3488]
MPVVVYIQFDGPIPLKMKVSQSDLQAEHLLKSSVDIPKLFFVELVPFVGAAYRLIQVCNETKQTQVHIHTMASSGSIYFYDPSLPASILFTILYAFPAAFLFYTTIIGPRTGKYGHAGYFVPLCIGAAMEVAAYADRCASVKQPGSIPLYAVSSSLVVIAPVFICASLYMLMGRLIRAGIPEAKGQQQVFGIAPRWLPRIFVASDIISFLTQVSGSAIASAGDWEGSEKGAGTNVLIGGLALQLATFSMFLAIVVRFHRRVHALRHQVDDNLKKVLLGLYVAGFFIWTH